MSNVCWDLKLGDALDVLKTLPDECVNACVTSPPYYGLRDYGTASWEGGDPDCDHKIPEGEHDPKRGIGRDSSSSHISRFNLTHCHKCGAKRIDNQIGLEPSPNQYVDKMVEIFSEVKRVLKKDGTLWFNIGDTYNSAKTGNTEVIKNPKVASSGFKKPLWGEAKPKDLIGIPWMLAFALRNDGWYLRQDIIWCLCENTSVYAKINNKEQSIKLKDLALIKPELVKLWNGNKWTQLLGMNRSRGKNDEIELILRSGESIPATPSHKFPTNNGLKKVSDIQIGDIIDSCRLPEPEYPTDSFLDMDIAWFAGIYLTAGSFCGEAMQIQEPSTDKEVWSRINKAVKKHGGSVSRIVDGNKRSILVYSDSLKQAVKDFVSGSTAKNKGFSPSVWQCSNNFIKSMMEGFLASGSCFENGCNRWGVATARNYKLEEGLRIACARLGWSLTLNKSFRKLNDKRVSLFVGEIKSFSENIVNIDCMNEVVDIKKINCSYVWDLGVEDEPHLFALASGVLTHNSKPNAMPEPVKDRCTKAHEYIFLLSKSSKYYYDHEAIAEPLSNTTLEDIKRRTKFDNKGTHGDVRPDLGRDRRDYVPESGKRNKRSVWSVNTRPYQGAHFAVFPPELIKPCILAGCPPGGLVLDPFAGSGTTLYVACTYERNALGIELNKDYSPLIHRRMEDIGLFCEKRSFEIE